MQLMLLRTRDWLWRGFIQAPSQNCFFTEQIELAVKLPEYFLWYNKSNINQLVKKDGDLEELFAKKANETFLTRLLCLLQNESKSENMTVLENLLVKKASELGYKIDPDTDITC